MPFVVRDGSLFWNLPRGHTDAKAAPSCQPLIGHGGNMAPAPLLPFPGWGRGTRTVLGHGQQGHERLCCSSLRFTMHGLARAYNTRVSGRHLRFRSHTITQGIFFRYSVTFIFKVRVWHCGFLPPRAPFCSGIPVLNLSTCPIVSLICHAKNICQ